MGAGESALREKNLRDSRKATDFYSAIVRHGGSFIGKPSLMYVGGNSVLFDYLNLERDVSMEQLQKCSINLGFTGEIRYFGVVKDGLKPLYTTEDLRVLARECESTRLLEVCLENENATAGCVKGARDMQGDGLPVGGESYVDDETIDSGAVFEEEDVVCDLSNADFDESTLSDEEGAPKEFPVFNKDAVYTPQFVLGMYFESRDLFRKAMISHAINSKRSLHFKKIDNKRVHVRCKDDGCDWACNALKVIGEDTFQIRTYNAVHKCAPSFHVTNLKSSWLGHKHLSDFQCDPKRDVRGWRKEKMKNLNVNISKQQAYRAKAVALQIIEGVPDLQYNKLWDYAEVLRSSNPGTTAILDIDEQSKFSKFYLCYDACKQGFKSCRKFIGVDGCWLKGQRGGILLSAVGVDPGNSIFPLAFAVVSIKNRETWEWFLINLKSDLGIVNSKDYCFMSDKQKGLILALKEVFPDAESRFCVRHMFNNLQTAGFRGLKFKGFLTRAAKASTKGMFKESMKAFEKYSEGAVEWLCDKDPSQWSWSHFKVQSKCDSLLNNICESFNSCILDARDRPILTMLEWIRQWLMERFQVNRDAARRWEGRLTPRIVVILRENMKEMTNCLPIKSNNRHYEIQCPDGSQFAVDLVERTCTCRRWDLSGIPCNHALSAIANQGEDPELYVDECYSIDTYKKVYDPAILPIPGQVEWAETLYIPPLPPNFGKKIGRPKKVRKRDGNDIKEKGKKIQIKMKRQKKISKCKKCGEQGHTKTKCKKQPGTSGHSGAQPQAAGGQPGENSEALPEPQHEVEQTHEQSTILQTETLTGQPSKKLKVRRNTSEVSQQSFMIGARGRGRSARGKGLTLSGTGSNISARALVDEVDHEFEALLSQANSGLHGPSPWEQLHMGTSTSLCTSQPTVFTTTEKRGGLSSMFSTQTREEASKKRIFK